MPIMKRIFQSNSKHKNIFKLLLIALFFSYNSSHGQPGTIDSQFLVNDVGFKLTSELNGKIQQALPLKNGKILIAGNFTGFTKWDINHIARLNADGSVDSTFISREGFNVSFLEFFDITELADSTVILVGTFNRYNGDTVKNIIKLNHDGSLDKSFCKDADILGTVRSISLQQDGKFILGGAFIKAYGQDYQSLVRLHEDGTLDPTFNVGNEFSQFGNSTIYDTKILSNGSIIAGGNFEDFADSGKQKNLVTLDSNGALDDSSIKFHTSSLSSVTALAVQTDGKIIAAEYYTGKLKRFLADGSDDTGFSQPNYSGTVNEIKVLADNSILVIGSVVNKSNATQKSILKLSSNGQIDPSFSGPKSLNHEGLSCKIIGGSKILLAGAFSSYDGGDFKYVTVLDLNGAIDNPIHLNKGDLPSGFEKVVNKIIIQTDQKIVVGGDFNSFFTDPAGKIARLTAAGDLDHTFNTGTGFAGGMVKTLAFQGSKIIVGGTFNSFDGNSAFGIARLNSDGSFDGSFSSGTGVGYGWSSKGNHHVAVNCIEVLANNKIYIAGRITEYDGSTATHIVRLNSDGTLDNGFQPEYDIRIGQANYGVKSIAIQDDGKIVLVGNIYTTTTNGNRSFIFRLNDDGTFDETYTNIDGNLSTWARTCVIQNDGKIIVAGLFGSVGSNWGNGGITRFNSDGSVDETFKSGTGSSGGSISKLVLQNDGKILVGGEFASFNGTTAEKLLRLNADGSVDNTFSSGAGIPETIYGTSSVTTSSVMDMAIQSDGKILIGGELFAYDGTGRNHLARIFGNDIATSMEEINAASDRINVYPNPSTGIFSLSVLVQQAQVVDINGQLIWTGKNINTVDLNSSPNGLYFLRMDGVYKKLIKN
ncbi:MAG: putative delta-60 repeat protein [Glaciecola sp.]